VTFLFTDVEDSSRLWEDASTDMADSLRAHDAIVRGAIERHGGAVLGDGGDGFRSAFSATCTDAVREHGLIKLEPPVPADATDTERLMAAVGRSIPR
jgi:class 3 adenylate cyclase